MKTQIIQLNQDDDIISVQDKIGWCQTSRILLVIPAGTLFFHSKLELNLLLRHTNDLGVQVALIAGDRDIRHYARLLGIPLFKDILRAQSSQWPMIQRKNFNSPRTVTYPKFEEIRKYFRSIRSRKQEALSVRIVSFSMSILALLAVGILVLPGATITLSPQIETQSVSQEVTTDPTLATPDLVNMSLPVVWKEVVVENREIIRSSGETTIPDKYATGSLLFTNTSDHKIIIASKTAVYSIAVEPIQFVTTNENAISLEAGKSILLAARAITPGPRGNLPPNSLKVLVGEIGSDISVNNPYATYGGTEVTVPAPISSDQQLCEANLMAKLEQAALLELQSTIPDSDVLISQSLISVEVINETISPKIGEPGETLSTSMRVKFKAQIVNRDVIEKVILPLMDARLSPGFSPVENMLSITSSPQIQKEQGKYSWTIRAQRKVEASISIDNSRDLLYGVTTTQAEQILKASLPIIGQPQITLTPAWWPRLPFLPMRISFELSKT